MIPICLPIACRPFDPFWGTHSLGEMSIECSHCHALHWKAESLSSSTIADIKFGMCCYQGKISLPSLHPPPIELHNYLTGQDPVAKEFRNRIRNYNYALSMTSVGRNLNYSINQGGGGPYTFVLQGQLNHLSGSLLPAEGVPPVYAQLYIHDSQIALQHRLQNTDNRHLDPFVLADLQHMLEAKHPGVGLYKQANALTCHMPPEHQCTVAQKTVPMFGCFVKTGLWKIE